MAVINYFYGRFAQGSSAIVHDGQKCVAAGGAGGCESAALGIFPGGVFSAAVDDEPEQSGGEIYEINVGELAVRAFGDWIEVADKREQHGEAREPGKNLRAARESGVIAQIARQRDAYQSIGHDETVGGERAEPAVNIEAACAARRQHDHG